MQSGGSFVGLREVTPCKSRRRPRAAGVMRRKVNTSRSSQIKECQEGPSEREKMEILRCSKLKKMLFECKLKLLVLSFRI